MTFRSFIPGAYVRSLTRPTLGIGVVVETRVSILVQWEKAPEVSYSSYQRIPSSAYDLSHRVHMHEDLVEVSPLEAIAGQAE